MKYSRIGAYYIFFTIIVPLQFLLLIFICSWELIGIFAIYDHRVLRLHRLVVFRNIESFTVVGDLLLVLVSQQLSRFSWS